MSERLTPEERKFAEDREAAYRRTAKHIARTIIAAPDRDKFTGPAQRYVDEHEFSMNPHEQGRVDAYRDLLRSLGRLTN